ncbi:kinase-like protein [Aureobasidium sp. EXF-3400]|nr:kinase-like protein [Aureobasidium sp. EXF-12344]KAI4782336.1 kinase-like protein [Aureobasidium sp. EXF-3400]
MSDAGGYYPDPYRNDRIDIELRALPRQDAPEGHSWVFGGKLGAGGFGRAYLWNLIANANQKVVDRVVLKYTEVRSEQVISNGGLGNGHIKEVFIQRSLVPNGTPPDKVFTVPLLGAEHCSWSLDSWRFYSPYFAFGDLFDLIKTQGLEDLRSTMTGHRQIPEPFAWYILHRLVSAAVVMDTKFRTSQKDYQVVHVDFKPENIFLGAPGSLGKKNSFPAYPPVYLGDFGNAHVTYPGDPWDYMMYGGCTQGWSAPEITRLGHVRRSWQAPGGSYTNVWQIGYVMQSILMGVVSWEQDIPWNDFDYDYEPRYMPLPKRTKAREAENPLRRDYSTELLDILNAMVSFKPEARPTPQQLLDVIEEYMPHFTQGMEHWGTQEWFDQLNGDEDSPEDDTIASETTPLQDDGSRKGVTDKFIDKFKHLFCVPRARPKRRTPRKSPIDRDLSPYSKLQARNKSRKRRQDMVTRQIKEGLRPKLQRFVSPDPSDDIFILPDDLKIIHPKRPETIGDYFAASDPEPTYYMEDIDDVEKYAKAKRAFERAHPDGYPPVGVEKYDFRKEGEKPGEVVLDPTAKK